MNEPTTSHVHGIPIPFAASVSFSDQNRRCGGGRGGGEGGANEHADIIHVHVAESTDIQVASEWSRCVRSTRSGMMVHPWNNEIFMDQLGLGG